MIRNFSFDGELGWSQGVAVGASAESILMSAIPDAVSIRKAAPHEDRDGIDWWVERRSGKDLGIDLKARREDFATRGEDDLALEIWSVIENRTLGWTRDARRRTDYVLWWWQDTGRWCLVPFPMLCAVFVQHGQNWTTAYRTAKQSTDGRYHSRCVFVPRRLVWRAIYDRFGGTPH